MYTRTAGSVSTTGRTVLKTNCFSSNHSYFLLIPAYRISVAVFIPNTTPNAETNAIAAAAAAVSGASASKIRTSCGLPDSGREILYVLLRIKGRTYH